MTPLNLELKMAVFAGKKEDAEGWLAKGADINCRDDIGNTPLMVAVVGGHLDIAEMLIARGADINAKDFSGWTPLMRVSYMGMTKSARFLLKNGADPDWQDENQQTALTLAQWERRSETEELLLNWPNVPAEEATATAADPTPTPEEIAQTCLDKLKSRRLSAPLFKRRPPGMGG